jgi:Predicted membrane protein
MSATILILSKIKKKLLALIFVPLVVIATLMLLFDNGLKRYPIVVCDEDQGFDMPMAGRVNIGQSLEAALRSPSFSLIHAVSPAEAKTLVEAGKAKAMLCLPAHLTEDLFIRMDDPSYVIEEKITLELQPANPLERILALSAIGRSCLGAIQAVAGDKLSLDSLPIPVELKGLIEGFKPAASYIPLALIGFVSYVLTGILSLLAAKDLRPHREELARSAFPAALVFVAAFALAGYLLYLGLLSAVALIFGLGLTTRMIEASAAVLLLLCVAPALSFAAGLAPDEARTRPVVPFLILPLFFGGFILPVEILPTWLQWIEYLFPPFYGLGAALPLALGEPASEGAFRIAATALWALAFLVAGIVFLRSKRMGSSMEVAK